MGEFMRGDYAAVTPYRCPAVEVGGFGSIQWWLGGGVGRRERPRRESFDRIPRTYAAPLAWRYNHPKFHGYKKAPLRQNNVR